MPNYFEHRLSAERYAAARPDVHAPALERFTAFAGLHGALDEVLDVGCGTGQSTVALAALARHVLGIDPAESMLANCAWFRNVDYTCATAESIPLNEAACDLVVAAQAFHWFDQDAFLGEAFRVLKDAGWLLIYNAWFTGEMEEDAAFLQWFREQYLGRYPSPRRRPVSITEASANEHGFVFAGEEPFSIRVPMTIERFTDYQLSTTNVIAAVKDHPTLFEEARYWIAVSIADFFGGAGERSFVFASRNWYLRKRRSGDRPAIRIE